VADEVVGPNFTELWISVDPDVPYQSTIDQIQEVVDGYPGLYRDVLTYLRERIKEVLTGASATIVVRIFGPELDVLRERAEAVAEAIREVPGVSELTVEPQTLVPQVQVRLRPQAAADFGLTPASVRAAVTLLVSGQKVGEVYEEQKIHDVIVWGVPSVRTDLSALREVLVETPGGGYVPLRDVAEVVIAPAPNQIKRERGSRRIDVTCNVTGRDLGSVARQIDEEIKALSFPRGYHPELLGEYAARQAARTRLLTLSVLALAGILVLLLADFQSPRLVLLVTLTLPFALVGGVFAAWATGGVLSLGSLVGFVTVLGIAARNGIMLVSHYRHLEREEGLPHGPALVMRGAEERLTPILMTASTAALALLPLVIRGNVPGHEIEYPMAVVIVGGLVTSTLLNLLILPALYGRFSRAN
jgi:Cu/Ag efflux pump CusA